MTLGLVSYFLICLKLSFSIEHYILEGQNVKRWSHTQPEKFNAIFAQPKFLEMEKKQPLIVFLHDGPHEKFCQSFNLAANTLLKMGMAVLMINYR